MASAGTGKTWLLVSRLLRLLLHGARADAILAITFTRKAAAEMQTRLSERLYQLASADDHELAELLRELELTPDHDTMARARGLYEELLQSGKSVRTTTFHAFCQDILRRFPLEADVPPGFELLEGSGELARTAWDTLVDQATQQPDGGLAKSLQQLLSYCGGLSALRQALFAFLEHRGDWWAYTEDQAEPQNYAIEQLYQQLQLDDQASPLQGLFSTEREQQLAEYCMLLNKHPTSTNEARVAQLAQASNPELALEERFEQARQVLLTKENKPRACKPNKTQEKKMGAEGQQRFIELHTQLCSALLQAQDQLRAEDTLEANRAWLSVGSQLLDNFQRLKAERRQLDFTDLEWRAYRLLHHAESAQWVQYKLDQRIDHLLVDEFQDTNPTQWRLLLPLLQEMAAGSAAGHRSVFLVGDAKQSIYRFRRAEPRLFQAAHDWLEQHLAARSYPLHTSWRSAPAIMQAVNKLFGDNGPMQGILRDFQPHKTNLSGLWGRVAVLPLVQGDDSEKKHHPEIPAELRNPLHQPRIIQEDQRYQQEGQMIASEIARLIADETPVDAPSGPRPMRYGDVMILVRSRAHVGKYEQALRQAGIPYIGAERGTLLDSLEVRDMVALLELLITPYNNLSLAQVLRSPLFACPDEALMELASMGSNAGSWYQRLGALAQDNSSHPLHRAWQLLDNWREQVGKLPIHDLLDRIFMEGNVLARYHSAYPPHLRARSESNLNRFLELALAVDSGRYPSLGRFLSRLAEMQANRDEAPDEAPTSGEQDRVRLMTIHASKGLEAPVVFLADSTRGLGKDRPFRSLIEWPAHAPRPSAFLLVGKKEQQDGFTRQLIERERKEEQREDGNLLYVALTRTRQLLYLSACAPSRGDEHGWYGAVRRALDPLDEVPPEQSCQLESGKPSRLVPQPEAKAAQAIVIPQELGETIPLQPKDHEIAPSYHLSQASAELAGGDEDGRQRGIIIHRLLELQSSGRSPQEVTLQVAQERGLGLHDAELQQCASEVELLNKEEALRELLSAKGAEVLCEVPVTYRQQGKTVHGIIDRLQLYADEAWIVDYKSHRGATQERLPEFAEPFRQQLDYYAQGVQQLWPSHKVRRFLLFTHCQALYEFH